MRCWGGLSKSFLGISITDYLIKRDLIDIFYNSLWKYQSQMTSNELYCLSDECSNQQGSIFNELLEHYSNPEMQLIYTQ